MSVSGRAGDRHAYRSWTNEGSRLILTGALGSTERLLLGDTVGGGAVAVVELLLSSCLGLFVGTTALAFDTEEILAAAFTFALLQILKASALFSLIA
jgi:hypothetical protein